MSIVYLNGNYLPDTEAKISVFDRGFLFADSVYEVIPIYQQRFIGLTEHLQRLENSLTTIRMPLPLTFAEFTAIFQRLVEVNTLSGENCIYLQISRGAQSIRSATIPKHITPTIFITCMPSPRQPFEIIQKGFRAITVTDKRRRECFIKSNELLPNILANQVALDQQADEAILIRDGYAIESTSSNLFMVKNGTLITPPIQPQMLAGITRAIILKLAYHHHISALEQMISETELLTADEVWLTGSGKEIYPIIAINQQLIGDGKPGPRWWQFVEFYQYFKDTGKYH